MSIKNQEYVCEKCHFITEYKNSYELHLQSQLHLTGRRKVRKDKKIPDKCPHCLYTTKVKTSMDTHIIRHHMSPEEQKEKMNFYCEHCNVGTSSEAQFIRHNNAKRHKNKLLYLGIESETSS